ncbi:hypothetical protein HY009_10050 [Candidatus Acetothermia bacterium]|nr:hypothetical protein [Candidatus Acetothermia bacterium]
MKNISRRQSQITRLVTTLVGVFSLSFLLSLGSVAQTSQTVAVGVPQSFSLDCTSAAISFTITKAQVEGPQPFQIGTWACNVDALTQYRLNSSLVTVNTNISNVSPSDFSATCMSASNGGACTLSTGLSGGDPTNRRGTGGNTAGTGGADFTGNLFVNVSTWDVGTLPGVYTGTIVVSVTDTTP